MSDASAAAADVKIADEKQYQWLTVTDSGVIKHLDVLSMGAVALHC